MKTENVVSVIEGAELNGQMRVLTLSEVDQVSGGLGFIVDAFATAYAAGVKAAEALIGKEEGWRTGGGF